MPRLVRTARGEVIDFDAVIIKQSIAQAPMNIEVQRRKDFIDSKEGKPRGQRQVAQPAQAAGYINPNTFVTNEPTKVSVPNDEVSTQAASKDAKSEDFDSNVPAVKSKSTVEAVPNIPTRSAK